MSNNVSGSGSPDRCFQGTKKRAYTSGFPLVFFWLTHLHNPLWQHLEFFRETHKSVCAIFDLVWVSSAYFAVSFLPLCNYNSIKFNCICSCYSTDFLTSNQLVHEMDRKNSFSFGYDFSSTNIYHQTLKLLTWNN